MRLFKCDLCEAEVGEYKLTELLPEFRTHEVEHVCEGCRRILSNKLHAIHCIINDVKGTFIKRFMRNMKAKLCGGGTATTGAKHDATPLEPQRTDAAGQ